MRSSRFWQSSAESRAPPWKGSTSRSPSAPDPHDEVARAARRRPTRGRRGGHLDVQRRERDRDAGAAVEHVVQEAVAGVVVVLGVAAEALLVEEVAVQRLHAPRGAARLEPRRARRAPISSSRAQVARDVELGVLLAGDEERGLGQVHLLVGHGQRSLNCRRAVGSCVMGPTIIRSGGARSFEGEPLQEAGFDQRFTNLFQNELESAEVSSQTRFKTSWPALRPPPPAQGTLRS